MSKSMDFKVGTADGKSDGLQVLGIGKPWPIYCKSRNIRHDGAQPKDPLHEGGGRTYASTRRVNIKSSIGRQKITLLYN